MADITIRVRNRIAEAVGSPEIICGNSDYNAIFDLDAEWDAQEIKTMRVAWTDTFSGQPRHIDVPFLWALQQSRQSQTPTRCRSVCIPETS